MKILSGDQLREADLYTIAHEPVSSIDLMERASNACYKWIVGHLPEKKSFYIVCGTGNNGGDGLAIARLLNNSGFKVRCSIIGDTSKASNDFKTNYQRLISSGLTAIFNDLKKIDSEEIIIDALFGTGLNRPLSGKYFEVVNELNSYGNKVISIDIPSGMFCEDNSNNNLEGIIQADYTLTFQQPKLSFLMADAGEKAGEWFVIDFGLSKEFIDKCSADFYFLEPSEIEKLKTPRKRFTHKGTYGHTLIIAGSKGMMGAAVLATRAALRSGAGLVTSFVPQCGYEIMQICNPEAMCIVSANNDYISGKLDWNKYDSIAIGPGLGIETQTLGTLIDLLSNYKGQIVIDADALNLIASKKELLSSLSDQVVLTPHPGEFDRLFEKCSSAFARLTKQKEKSISLGCTIILKGAYSSISSAKGPILFNSSGNPGMAKGGSGDVLTGVLAGILASEKNIIYACSKAVFVHGKAGDVIAVELGQELLTSKDLANKISEILNMK